MTDLAVQARLDLDATGFEQGAQRGQTAVRGLTEAEKQLVQVNGAVASSSDRVVAGAAAQAAGFARLAQQVANTSSTMAAQAATATVSAASQAAGFARLAQQRTIEAGKAESAAMMGSVEQSTASLAALYGINSKATAAAAKGNETLAGSATKLKAANDDTARSVENVSGKLNAYQRQNLAFQFNDIFVQLASGQGVIRTLVQQGPQITQIYGGISNTIRAIPAGIASAVALLGALAIVFGSAAASASQSAERQRQFTLQLTATGNAAGTTAARLEQLVRVQALRPGAGRADTGAALGGLLLNSNLDEQALSRTLALSRDYARITGQELPEAAQQLGKALDGTSASARQLDQAFNFLSASELEQIRKLEQQGDKGAVVATVLAAMERNFKGANEQGISPTTKALNDLSAAWTKFETNLGNSAIVRGLLNGTAGVLSAAAQAIGGGGGVGPVPTVADVQGLRGELANAQKVLNDLRSVDINRVVNPAGLQSQIAAQQKIVESIRAKIGEAERGLTNAVVNAGDASLQGEATRFEEKLKLYGLAAAKFNTLSQQRGALEADIGKIQERFKLGGLSPEQLAASQEQLVKLQRELRNLESPAAALQRQLDLGTELAKMPPHLREARQAWDSTYEAAKKVTSLEEARRMADQAAQATLDSKASATREQISLLSAEAQGALAVAEAYGRSRSAGLQAAARQAADQAVQSGAIAPGEEGAFAQQTLQRDASAAVAAQAERNRAYGEEIAGLQRIVAAEALSSEAAREAERVNRVATVAIQLRAQAAASGSAAIAAAAEREISTFDRLSQQQLDLDRRRAARQVNAQYDPETNYRQRIAALEALRQTGELTERAVAEYTKQAEQERLDASCSATDGMIAGLRRYAEEATNAGQAASQGIQAGLRSMEDALVQFVTTGQISFTNLANSIIADIARVAIRQNITGPLAQGLSSGLGGIFGSIFGSSSSSAAGIAAGITPGGGIGAGVYHSGGIVGGAAPTRDVPISLFANARRYHGGGVVLGADEVPIIAKRGERVLTEEQQRQGGGPLVQVNIVNQTDSKVTAKQSRGAGGMPKLEILVEAFESAMAGNVTRGTGALFGAISGTFGLQPAARGGG